INNATISNNTADTAAGTRHGGGFYKFAGALTIKNTIVAGNFDPGASPAPDCGQGTTSGTTSDGYNLIGNTTGCSFPVGPGDLFNRPAGLGALGDNGGRMTLTHALLPGSPAINAGNPAFPGSGGAACQIIDQREVGRPQQGRCDIGAFELVPSPSTPA